MPFRLRRGRKPPSELRRAAAEQLERALAELADADLDPDRKVRQVRRRLKKVRSVIRLAQPSGRSDDDALFRDLGRRLSALRDRQALLETLETLSCGCLSEDEAAALVAARHALMADASPERYDDALEQTARDLAEGLDRISRWKISGSGFDALADGLERTYRRARKRLRKAAKTGVAEHFHDARKDVKHHWRHLQLLADAWPAVLRIRARHARDLGEMLGDDHDLVVLRQTLAEAPGDPARFTALEPRIERRSKRLRKQAKRLGARLFAEPPDAFRRRMEALWKA